MKTKIFIDGSQGTTGLRIDERFENRDDIEVMKIDPELRKDLKERKRLINESDITFLCLPDDAARESVSFVENDKVRIFDTSTAHRTNPDWAYGYPELCPEQRQKIKNSNRIAVPGCHATGFISLAYPLVSQGIVPKDYPVSSFSLTGYSGGGKKRIAEYQNPNRSSDFDAPSTYALSEQHKHLKEMKGITGLTKEPLFTPIIADYYSGMIVCFPVYTELLNKSKTLEEIHSFYAEYYKNEKFVQVMPLGSESEFGGCMAGNKCAGWDGLKIYVTGNDERVLISSQFDNLGKGSSGAAVQCMNIVLGCKEDKGLNL